jgi:pimeloyl-ACP methyl ester carboxylesterase
MAQSAVVNGVELIYEVVALSDVATHPINVVITPGGQSSRESLRFVAHDLLRILGPSVRCLLWDRRGCGASGLGLKHGWMAGACVGLSPCPPSSTKSRDKSAGKCLRACCNAPVGEPEVHADDCASLLRYLGWTRVVCIGLSAGARVSLFLALRHPDLVSGIAAMSITAGGVAAFVLSDVYYDQYAVAVAETGGMLAIARKPHYAACIRANPKRQEELLAMDPSEFRETMIQFRDFLAKSADYPVVGLTSEQLASISCPVLVLRTFPDDSDAMHTLAASRALFHSVARPAGLVVSHDSDKYVPEIASFVVAVGRCGCSPAPPTTPCSML